MRQTEIVAMILAGGQGSRLGVLTEKIAKPGLSFGGKYRIIDFVLSNCANSGISTVGVLTQYQPLELNTYIGSGQPWDLDRLNGGVYILPPFVKGQRGEWYKGTANAIYQNIRFIEQFNPEDVAILSGDHIYTMDYREMWRFHRANSASLTIASIEVPISEANRFGILQTDVYGKVIGFEEKPEKPLGTLASMGVYIFNWNTLKSYLESDEKDVHSSNDFGKDLIPKMMQDQCPIFAYQFSGYWKDVGTIKSLWEANMEMLGSPPALNIDDDHWRVYSRHIDLPPHYISHSANIRNSAITEGCNVFGNVERSVLFSGVTIEEGAHVTDSIIFPFTKIKSGATVDKAIIAQDCIIGENAFVGSDSPNISFPHDPLCSDNLTLVAQGIKIGKNVQIGREVSITDDVFLAEIREED